MRIDASNLLSRLGRQDFLYTEFEDRFTELELWPMLEALLKDPRLQAVDTTAGDKSLDSHQSAPLSPAAEVEGATPPEELSPHHEGEPPAPDTATTTAGSGQDVRAMLRHLSELGSRGEI